MKSRRWRRRETRSHASTASARRHATATPSTRPRERPRVPRGSRDAAIDALTSSPRGRERAPTRHVTQVRDQMDVANPFRFAHVQNLNSVDDLDDTGPCVVMAAPGMLQSGVSRRFFDKWASSERNGVVIAGYSVEGTLAKQILSDQMR